VIIFCIYGPHPKYSKLAEPLLLTTANGGGFIGNNKKAPPIDQRSLCIMGRLHGNIQLVASDLSVPFSGMELAPAPPLPRWEVAKASQGHDPLPFWISDVKNWCKGNITKFDFPNFLSQINFHLTPKPFTGRPFSL
jgi:hypothetical protein